jgi:hypothetical protein
MKRLNLLLTATLMVAMIALVGCAKEEGCTDPDATNFSSEAEDDDGSCSFTGNIVFFYDQTASEGLVMDGAQNLTFYVDNAVVGSTATSVYWNGSPDCGDNASITVTKNLGNVKTQSFSYRVEDQTGFEYWSGTINFNANTCTSLELPW